MKSSTAFSRCVCASAAGAALLTLAPPTPADDWPQWRGPARNGISRETGLLKSWPEGGPKLLWTAEGLGSSYASTAIAHGRIYASGAVAGEGYLFCIDPEGKLLWKTGYGPEGHGGDAYARSTPTIDGDRVYLMSAEGTVVCFDAATGEIRWKLDTAKELKALQLSHGISESVLVAGDVVVCTPGGPDATVIGIDKASGRVRWQTRGLSEGSGYNQPLLVRCGDRDLVVVMSDKSMLGIDSADGTVLWRQPYGDPGVHTALGQQCFTPVFADGILYAPMGPEAVAQGFSLAADGSSVQRIWEQKRMTVHHGGAVIVNGHIYGTHGHWRAVCLDLRTGSVVYESARRVGMAAIIYADGMLYMSFLDGTVQLVRATPTGYQPVSSFKIPKGSGDCYSHPAIADGRLYLRHGDALMAYDIRNAAP